MAMTGEEARGYHNKRVSHGISDTLGKSAGKAADFRQAYYRWESNLKEFQRGRPTGLDDDVKANAMRHVMQKKTLDAVNLQPQYRTFVEIRDYMLQQARQRADVFVRDVCFATKKVVTTPSRVNTSTKNSTATKNTALVPMDVSQMSSDVSKSEAEGQESDSYQYEQDQDCDGDEVCAVKGKGQGGFMGVESEDTRLTDVGRREKGKEKRETGRKAKENTEERVDPKERDVPKESGQIQVTRGKILGIIPIGTARRVVLRLIRERLLNLFFISVESV